MTREKFLTKMDKIKNLVIKDISYTCNLLDYILGNDAADCYIYLFSSVHEYSPNYIVTNFGYIRDKEHLKMTRLTALELFEIISLKEKLYLEY